MIASIALALVLSGSKPFEFAVESAENPPRLILRTRGDPLAVDASPDGQSLALGVKDWVAAASFKTGALSWSVKLGPGYVRGVSYSPDGSQIAVAAIGGVYLLDARSGAQRWRARGHPAVVPPQADRGSGLPESEAYGAAFTPDGSEVWTVSRDDRFIRRWSAADGAPRGELDAGLGNLKQVLRGPLGVCVSGEKQGVACFQGSGAELWRQPKAQVWGTLALGDDALMVGGTRGGAVAFRLSLKTGEQLGMVAGLGEGTVAGVGVASSGHFISAVDRSGIIMTRRGAPGEPQLVSTALDAKVRISRDALPALVFGLGGTAVAVATKDDATVIYRLP